VVDNPVIEWSGDVAAVGWIARRLHPHTGRVTSLVPAGFPAYARILHPACHNNGGRWTMVRWADVATVTGAVAHPGMQFEAIASPQHPTDRAPGGAGWRGLPPILGSLTAADVAVLAGVLAAATETPDRCWFCIWEGHGWLQGSPSAAVLTARGAAPVSAIAPPAVLAGPRVRLGGRAYLLYRGPIETAGAFARHPWNQTPNLWWPEDRAWCVASEVDLPSTYVGGSAALAGRLRSEARVEVVSAEPDADITVRGDRINT